MVFRENQDLNSSEKEYVHNRLTKIFKQVFKEDGQYSIVTNGGEKHLSEFGFAFPIMFDIDVVKYGSEIFLKKKIVVLFCNTTTDDNIKIQFEKDNFIPVDDRFEKCVFITIQVPYYKKESFQKVAYAMFEKFRKWKEWY